MSERFSFVMEQSLTLQQELEIIELYKSGKGCPENLWNHLIRGAIDGDGSIFLSKRGDAGFSMTGNVLFLQKIKEILETTLNIYIGLGPRGKGSPDNIIIIRTHSIPNIIKIRNYLYKDATIFLQRKYDKFNLLN